MNEAKDKTKTEPSATTFRVLVDDNYHYGDADERYAAGSYPTYDQAVAVAGGS